MGTCISKIPGGRVTTVSSERVANEIFLSGQLANTGSDARVVFSDSCMELRQEELSFCLTGRSCVVQRRPPLRLPLSTKLWNENDQNSKIKHRCRNISLLLNMIPMISGKLQLYCNSSYSYQITVMAVTSLSSTLQHIAVPWYQQQLNTIEFDAICTHT